MGADEDDLPLWRAADVRERRAGLEVVTSPPPQPKPRTPKPRTRKSTGGVPAAPTAHVSAIPLWRNRRAVEELADKALAYEPGTDRTRFLNMWFAGLATRRRKLGLPDGWIVAERAGLLAALEDVVRHLVGSPGGVA